MQNIIFKGDRGRNNPVRINVAIEFGDLNDFTDIKVVAGSDERTLLSNPLNVIVESANVLALYFYDTTEVQDGHFIISGINAGNPFGLLITSICQSNLSRYKICE